ncbi:hypothetical protein NKH18_00495 [Streptomyces sp. M10(2022)]
MATTTAEPKARKRRRKTRTKNVSPLPAIVASQLKADEINLTPGKEHVICPTCSNWTPITGILSTPVLVPTTPPRTTTAPPPPPLLQQQPPDHPRHRDRRLAGGTDRADRGVRDGRLPPADEGTAQAQDKRRRCREPAQARPAQRGAGPQDVPSAPEAVPGLQGRGHGPDRADTALPRR